MAATSWLTSATTSIRLADAQEFYLTGWEERQYLDDSDQPVGLDHSGLYSRGRLIDRRSIYGDALGHEGGAARDARKVH